VIRMTTLGEDQAVASEGSLFQETGTSRGFSYSTVWCCQPKATLQQRTGVDKPKRARLVPYLSRKGQRRRFGCGAYSGMWSTTQLKRRYLVDKLLRPHEMARVKELGASTAGGNAHKWF
jgi:hypothetical protein